MSNILIHNSYSASFTRIMTKSLKFDPMSKATYGLPAFLIQSVNVIVDVTRVISAE